ncbi:hypothetical protein D1872_230970 [compost metagenome]
MILNEAQVMPALINDVFGHCGKPDEVRPLLWMDEQIGALCHLMLAQVSNDQLLPV